jgi:hypothetical protein
MTRSASDLLALCDAQGIRVQALPDGRLDVDAPEELLTPELVEALRGCKAELLTMLAGGPERIGTGMVAGDPRDGAPVAGAPRDGAPVAGDPRDGAPVAGDPRDGAPVIDPQDPPDFLEVIEADGRRIWQRPEMVALEVIDFPDPCPVCGGIERWQDLVDGWHCERCEPRTAGPRLRELVQRLRVRYGML